MIKTFIILFQTFLYSSYKLLENVSCVIPKKFDFCSEIHPSILGTTEEVFSDLRFSGIPIYINKNQNTGTICNKDSTHYGLMLYDPIKPTNQTDMLFKTNLVYTPNTLYNVILHESLHSLGLDHNNGELGMMNYAVSQNWYGVKDDERKLYISIDDIRGITQSCKNFLVKNKDE